MWITPEEKEKGICIDMRNTFTAVVKQDDDWWIGWIKEIPGVNCQEATREKLLETLRVTLREGEE